MNVRYLNILILFFFTCLSSVNTYAQEKNISDYWLEEYNAGYNLYEEGKFNDAILRLKKAAEVIKDINFNVDEASKYYPADNYNYIGICYFNLGQFEDAAQYFSSVLEVLSSIDNVDMVYGKQILDNLLSSYEKYDLNKALELNNQILKYIEQDTGKSSIIYAEQLFINFQYNNTLQNSNEALGNLNEAYTILTNLEATDHIKYPYIIFNLAYTYYHNADYENALFYFKKTENHIPFYREQQWVNLSKLNYDYALCLFKQGLHHKSELKFKSLLDDQWLKSTENADFYLYATNYIGLSLYYQDKAEDAKHVYINSLNHLTNVLDTSDPLLALQKTNLTKLLIYNEDYTNALSISTEVYEIMENAGLTQSQAYINSVNNLGLLYMYKFDFKNSETYLKKALDITENSYDPNLLTIADIKSNLAYVYQKLGQYTKAKSYHKEALNIKTEFLDPLSPDYAKALQNYGTYLFETGEHLKSEDYFKQSETIFIRNKDTTSLLYAGLKQNLGLLYIKTSRLKESLKNLDEAIKIYNAKNLNLSENLASALNSKANCLILLGDINSALEIGKQSFELIKQTNDEESMQYGDALFTYANILRSNYEFDTSNTYLNKAYKIFEKHKDYSNERIIEFAKSYITDLVVDRNYDEAFKLLEAIEEHQIKTYGFESYNYAQTLYQKAQIASDAGDLEYAIRLYESVSNVFEKTISKNSDAYNNMLFEYAYTLDIANKIDEAIIKYINYNNGIEDVLKNVFTYRNEADKKKFLNQLKYKNDKINANIFNNENEYKALIPIALNNQLMLKSLLLNASKEIINNLSQSKDLSIKEALDKYGSIKFQLSEPIVLNDKQRTAELRNELNTIETQLVKLHDEKFGNNLNQNFSRDWTKIKASLKPKEVAIEFVEFRDSDSLKTDVVYGAYIITENSILPKATQLFKEDDLKAILKNQSPNLLYQTRGSKAKSATNTKGLYELIWSPIEQYLKGIETIYFSPSGLLNQIPFAALDTAEKPILASQYNLVQLSSTYTLTEERIEPKANNTLFIGGINYEYTPSEFKAESKDAISQLSALKSVSGTRSFDSKWNYLPGTLKEVNTIESLFSKQNKTYSSLANDSATETSFKNLSGDSPNVIHIATHGFFFENPKNTNQEALNVTQQNIYTVAEDPLLRSGLLFSGANYAWQNGNNPYTEDDGILTALEISNLDLSNTDLVVLSACETGLGDIDGSEGVYGLQRAFKMAGADLIMMSLWEVPDEETSEFMTIFYTNWLNGQQVRTAFRNTQLEMATKNKDNPEKWAAFVLFE